MVVNGEVIRGGVILRQEMDPNGDGLGENVSRIPPYLSLAVWCRMFQSWMPTSSVPSRKDRPEHHLLGPDERAEQQSSRPPLPDTPLSPHHHRRFQHRRLLPLPPDSRAELQWPASALSEYSTEEPTRSASLCERLSYHHGQEGHVLRLFRRRRDLFSR